MTSPCLHSDPHFLGPALSPCWEHLQAALVPLQPGPLYLCSPISSVPGTSKVRLLPPPCPRGPPSPVPMPCAGCLTSQRAISHCGGAGAGACPEGRGHAASLGATQARPRRQSKRRAWNLGCVALDLESGALRPDLKLRRGRWANPAAPRSRLNFPLGGLGKEGVGSGLQGPSQLHDSARAAPSSLSPRAPASPLRVPKSWRQPGLQLGHQPGRGDRSAETHEWPREAAEASSVCARPRRAACWDLRSVGAAVGARRRGGGGGAPTLPRVRPTGGAARRGGAGRSGGGAGVWGRGGGRAGGLGAGPARRGAAAKLRAGAAVRGAADARTGRRLRGQAPHLRAGASRRSSTGTAGLRPSCRCDECR